MKVSVVIPAYNAERYLPETLGSVLAQSRPVDEIIVVDDGSSDGTREAAEGRSRSVRVIRQANGGESAARNTGMKAASGDLVAFLDADDLWEPAKVEEQVAFLHARPDYVAVGSGYMDWDGRQVLSEIRPVNLEPGEQSPLTHFTGFPSSVRISTLMMRRAKGLEFPVGVAANADVFFMTMLAARGPIGAVPTPLVKYRRHASQVTAQPRFFARLLESRLAFARSNAGMLGLRDEHEAAQLVFGNAVEWLKVYRWTRDLASYRAYRAALTAQWPKSLPRDRELTRFLPPERVLRFIDGLKSLLPARRL